MDTGKAAAALVTNPGDPIDYLEVVGTGRKMSQPSLPFVAIPTTSGTGSEVTRNAVIAIPDKRIKVSLRSQSMLPKLAVVDPGLTLTVPRHITAATGMDALTQLIEPFVCNSPSPFTDSLCRDGIARVARSLAPACNDAQNISARENMSIASLFGGLALANARLGAVHGMANPIGGLVHAPHGAICARLLPLVMKANVQALRKRQPNSSAVDRYTEIASILTGRGDARAEDGVEWVQELCATLNVRPLSEFGLVKKDIPILVENSQKASSMKGNPVTLTPDELIEIIEKAG
jgi:alcohol dehydrogenase class IV